MGFKVPKKTFRLVFEDEDYAGAEIVCRSVKLSELFEITGMSDKPKEMFRRFGDEVVVEWNLEDDDGKPLPADGEGMLAQPVEFSNVLVKAWSEGLTTVAAPLVKK